MIRPGVKRILRLFRRQAADARAQVDEEIGLHIELRIEQLMQQGYSYESARREAERRFGEAARLHRRAVRRDQTIRFNEWLFDLSGDLRHSVRTLAREPLFAAVVVLTLGLGTGANAAMFGVVDRLLLRGPDHVVEPERVHKLFMTQRPPDQAEWTSPDFGFVEYALQKADARLYDVAAYTGGSSILGRGDEAREVTSSYVTADLFPLLGVRPALGRFFTAEEDIQTGEKVVVIGYSLWQSDFAGARDILGRSIRIGSDDFTVVGVAPKGFTGVGLARVDLWLPLSLSGTARSTQEWKSAWDVQWLSIAARLKPNVTSVQAQAEATAVHRRGFNGDDPSFAAATLSLHPLAVNDAAQEPAELAISRWLIGVSLIVLLIACANVTNLMLARTLRRKRDVGVRLVLGISRARLARMLLTEGLLLAAGGLLVGLLLANWGAQLLRAVLLPDVEWSSSPLNQRVLWFSALITLLVALVISVLPILQARRTTLSEALKSGTREGGGRRSTIRAVLTVAQAALAVVLLIGAGLFVRSLYNVRGLDLGIETDRIALVSMRWPSVPNMTEEMRAARRQHQYAFYDRAMERLKRLPGVAAVASSVGTPFNTSFSIRTRAQGVDSMPTLSTGGPKIAAVSPGYFETVGTRLLRGRAITTDDRANTERVAVVNATMARTVWPGQEALGKCLLLGNEPKACTRVVGIVADARRFSIREQPSMQYYIPIGQEQEYGFGGRSLQVRPRGELADISERVRRELFALDPALLYVNVRMLQEDVDPQIRPWRMGATMFALFGGLALIIALIGLYSLIAYFVSSRTQELGVRMALGARVADIVGMILRQALALTALGIAIGVLIALLAGQRMESLLFDVSPRDPQVFAVIAALLLACALAASALPARRAARVDPASSLRAE